MLRILSIAALACLAGACSKPTPAPTDQPPEPQATQLREAIQQPLDKAKAVEGQVQQAADEQRAQIDASGG